MSDSLIEAVRWASAELGAAGVDSPRADAVSLAAFAMGVGRAEVERLLVLGAPSPPGFADLVAARARRVPLQHLTGQAHFRQLTLLVGPGVFVPRPESELTAGLVIAHLQQLAQVAPAGTGSGPIVVDLGTGSGAIALSVAAEAPPAQIHAVERSDAAARWAERNIERLALPVTLHRIDLRDALPNLAGQVEVVVSNPPYIPPDAVPVQVEAREHDPPEALYGGGPDGLDTPRAVVERAELLLRADGLLVMEHADVQGATITQLLEAGPWCEVVDHLDLAGRPRVVTARRSAAGRVGPA